MILWNGVVHRTVGNSQRSLNSTLNCNVLTLSFLKQYCCNECLIPQFSSPAERSTSRSDEFISFNKPYLFSVNNINLAPIHACFIKLDIWWCNRGSWKVNEFIMKSCLACVSTAAFYIANIYKLVISRR